MPDPIDSPGGPDVPVVAVVLPRPQAAAAVTDAWAADEAVCVLDPTTPAAVRVTLLDRARPTHLEDEAGRRALPGGVPAPAGTSTVVMTSGTTGDPKGVELTHVGLEAMGAGFLEALGHEPDDRWLVCLPLHHVAGLAILARARVSGAAVVVHDGFDLAAVAAAPDAERATLVSLVPTMLHRLLDADAPIDAYRRIVLGGAPTPPALRAEAASRGAQVIDAYGLSETWGGIVLDGVPLAGAEVSLGADDEILLRGPMVMRGYRFASDATADVFTPEGWFRTGDVGARDRDGRVRVVDRLKDLVITGGVNVSPIAVETVLAAHADVADIAIAGAPDDEWGERIVAFVVPRDRQSPPGLDDLRAFGRDRLTRAQLPHEIVLVNAIPRTSGGKVLRRRLRRIG